jgi:hypothetical protein
MMLRAVVDSLRVVVRRRVMALGGREVLPDQGPAAAMLHDLPVGHLVALARRPL